MPHTPTEPQADCATVLPEERRTRCEVWTRVMGYHRPVAAWNPGKRSEHAERQYFLESGGRPRPNGDPH